MNCEPQYNVVEEKKITEMRQKPNEKLFNISGAMFISLI